MGSVFIEDHSSNGVRTCLLARCGERGRDEGVEERSSSGLDHSKKQRGGKICFIGLQGSVAQFRDARLRESTRVDPRIGSGSTPDRSHIGQKRPEAALDSPQIPQRLLGGSELDPGPTPRIGSGESSHWPSCLQASCSPTPSPSFSPCCAPTGLSLALCVFSRKGGRQEGPSRVASLTTRAVANRSTIPDQTRFGVRPGSPGPRFPLKSH